MNRTITLYPNHRDELREWLMTHASTEKEVWVHCIRRKHDTILPYVEVVEEALCFGWIDSTVHRNPDGEGIFQRLSPRRKGSHWTELNINRCQRMIEAGRMTEAGLTVLKTATNVPENAPIGKKSEECAGKQQKCAGKRPNRKD